MYVCMYKNTYIIVDYALCSTSFSVKCSSGCPFPSVHCTRSVSFWSEMHTNLMIVASEAISINDSACQCFQWDAVADIMYTAIRLSSVVQV